MPRNRPRHPHRNRPNPSAHSPKHQPKSLASLYAPLSNPNHLYLLALIALLLAIPSIALQYHFGLASAKSRHLTPAAQTLYVLTPILVWLAIAIVAAFLTYRLSQKSLRSAAAVFYLSFLLAAISSALISRLTPSTPDAPSPPTTPDPLPPQSYPLAGFSVSSPPGWQPIPPDRPETIARWLTSDSRPNDDKGIIMIQTDRPSPNDPLASAQDVAKHWGARITNDHDSLDGALAIRFHVDSPAPGLQPVDGLFCVHDNVEYKITASVTPNHPASQPVDSIRQSWHWIPLQPVTQFLDFIQPPRLIFNNQIFIAYPRIMTDFIPQSPASSLGLNLFNVRRGPDFSAVVTLLPIPFGDPFTTAKKNLAIAAADTLHLLHPPLWTDLPSPRESSITNLAPAAHDTKSTILALINVDAAQSVFINFTIYAPDPADQSIYTQTAQKIAQSVTPFPK